MSEWEEALAKARREREPERKDEDEHRARQMLTERRRVERAGEREQALKRRADRERAELAKRAGQAHRKTYGRSVASQILPWSRYWLLSADRRTWAFTARPALIEAAVILQRGGLTPRIQGERQIDLTQAQARALLDRDPGIEGAFLTRSTGVLDDVDPEVCTFSALLTQREAARIETARAEAEKQTARRRRQREKRLFGIELDAE